MKFSVAIWPKWWPNVDMQPWDVLVTNEDEQLLQACKLPIKIAITISVN